MKFFNSVSLLSIALCSTLVLSACNKNETDTATEAPTDTAVVADTATTETRADSSNIAKQMAKQSIQAFMLPALASGNLSAAQNACLQDRDENLGVAETQGFINDMYTDEEIEAINDAYSSDIMKKINQFSEEQMAIMSGKTVANPMTPPTEAEMKEFQAMFENDPRLKKLQEMNQNTDPSQNKFVIALKPVINGEFKRCDIDLTMEKLMQPPAAPAG